MGTLFHIAASPIGDLARFPGEREMEAFLYDHPQLLADHLATGDNEGQILKMWPQVDLPLGTSRGGRGRLDLLFVHQDGDHLTLCVCELKNTPVGQNEVKQLVEYLRNWGNDENAGVRKKAQDWIGQNCKVDGADRIATEAQGVLVAPGYTPEAVNSLVEWAQKNPGNPIQALKLIRFRSSDSPGHIVLVDDFYVVPQKGRKRTIRWAELHNAFPELITEDTAFVLSCGGEEFEATPDFGEGRGKNLRLAQKHVAATLERIDVALSNAKHYEIDTIKSAAARLRKGLSIPMSNLTLLLQRAFGGEGEPNWQVPAPLWKLEDDPEGKTIFDLDARLR